MGRTQPTVVVQPQAVRRADRSKKARETVNKVLPELLRSSPRARHGVHKASLVLDPPPNPIQDAASNGQSHANLRITLQSTDTLTAARRLTSASRRASFSINAPKSKSPPNVCILNMASPLRAGGGFLEGATSQEEFLCMRSTLYPSLWDDFYRLPEVGGIFTPDVLVFRDSTPDALELPKRERFFVDVVSAGMLRFPETKGKAMTEEEGGCSCGVSYCDRDRELVTRKMKAVMRMAQSQGTEKVVLGAWGCGAYGNPVKEVAKIWRRVIVGTARKKEDWSGINEVAFAITDRSMSREFEKCFSDVLDKTPLSPPPEPETLATQTDGQAEDPKPYTFGALTQYSTGTETTSDLITSLVAKIQETELTLDQIRNPRSKARLRLVLENLNKQLSLAGAPADDPLSASQNVSDDEDAVGEEDWVGIEASDGEESHYYDPDDVPSSGTSSPGLSADDTYDFRTHGPTSPSTTRRPRTASFDPESGWFSGSINGLHALLAPKRAVGSPVLRPDSGGGPGGGVGGYEEVVLGERLDLGEYLRRYSSREDD